MVKGLLRVEGEPLPLISNGRTATQTVRFGFGLLISADIHQDIRINRHAEFERQPVMASITLEGVTSATPAIVTLRSRGG